MTAEVVMLAKAGIQDLKRNRLWRFISSVIPAKAGIQGSIGTAFGDSTLPSFRRKPEFRFLNGIASGDTLKGFYAARRAAAGYFLVATRK